MTLLWCSRARRAPKLSHPAVCAVAKMIPPGEERRFAANGWRWTIASGTRSFFEPVDRISVRHDAKLAKVQTTSKARRTLLADACALASCRPILPRARGLATAIAAPMMGGDHRTNQPGKRLAPSRAARRQNTPSSASDPSRGTIAGDIAIRGWLTAALTVALGRKRRAMSPPACHVGDERRLRPSQPRSR